MGGVPHDQSHPQRTRHVEARIAGPAEVRIECGAPTAELDVAVLGRVAEVRAGDQEQLVVASNKLRMLLCVVKSALLAEAAVELAGYVSLE